MKHFGSKSSKSEKKRIWPRVLIITAAVIAVILLGAYTAFEIWVRPPAQHDYSADAAETAAPSPEGGEGDPSENTEALPTETPEPTEMPAPEGGYANENRYTFLVVGKEPDGYNTDTILVGTFDIEEEWLHIVSIPRDTLVNVPWWPSKINSVYSMSASGYKSWQYDSEIEGLCAAVKDIMGYEPAYWAVIDMEAFEKLVDAIGGITYNVPYDMDKDEPEIHFSAGEQWLSGADALKVVRYRDYPMGDIDRISVQQDFLKTLANEMLSLGNIPNIGKVYSIYDEYVETNLASGNIAWFIREFMKLDPEQITFATMPGNYCLAIKGISFVGIYLDDWLAMINSDLSPLEREITAEDVNIVRYSDSWGYYATSGEVKVP